MLQKETMPEFFKIDTNPNIPVPTGNLHRVSHLNVRSVRIALPSLGEIPEGSLVT